jgi:hypothetical protein
MTRPVTSIQNILLNPFKFPPLEEVLREAFQRGPKLGMV